VIVVKFEFNWILNHVGVGDNDQISGIQSDLEPGGFERSGSLMLPAEPGKEAVSNLATAKLITPPVAVTLWHHRHSREISGDLGSVDEV
jgi:hypothetical protein